MRTEFDQFHLHLNGSACVITLLCGAQKSQALSSACSGGRRWNHNSPRPDRAAHTAGGVLKLAEWMAPWRPKFELSVGGFPDYRLLEIAQIVRAQSRAPLCLT